MKAAAAWMQAFLAALPLLLPSIVRVVVVDPKDMKEAPTRLLAFLATRLLMLPSPKDMKEAADWMLALWAMLLPMLPS